uniref:Centromere protein S n=1 Tax=Rodentolepis nana TaxID=102285 RepID=A0A0R3T5F4_RODNA
LQSEHLSTLHYECTIRAKEISERSGVKIPDEIASLVTETTFRFCQLLSTDIESFARHAKRSTINMDDVLLFTRRNPLLTAFLEEKSAEFDAVADAKESNSEFQPAKRKKQTTLSKLKDGPASRSEESPLRSSPLKALFVESERMTPKANTPTPSQSSGRTASPITSSILLEANTGEGAASSAFETSLFDDKDDFSNIFDDFDAL